ncbi:Abi-alpha family protein [Pseudomonas luteola]
MLDVNLELPPEMGELANAVYSDAVRDTLREISKIGVDAAKTLRLALAPLQYSALLQDRLATYFKRAAEKSAPENRMSPPPSLALPILEKLRYQEKSDLLTDIYVELLSAGFDKTRMKDAHPAFLTVISQLSADEIKLVNTLAGSEPKNYFGKEPADWTQSSKSIEQYLKQNVSDFQVNWGVAVNPDHFAWPVHLQMYIAHLRSLDLIEYDNDPKYMAGRGLDHGQECWAIKLSLFGTLFHRACVQGASSESLAVTSRDRV